MVARYTHDCTTCLFLGVHNDCDLYFCPRTKSVIVRFSSDGPDYTSLPAKLAENLADNVGQALEEPHVQGVYVAYHLAVGLGHYNPKRESISTSLLRERLVLEIEAALKEVRSQKSPHDAHTMLARVEGHLLRAEALLKP